MCRHISLRASTPSAAVEIGGNLNEQGRSRTGGKIRPRRPKASEHESGSKMVETGVACRASRHSRSRHHDAEWEDHVLTQLTPGFVLLAYTEKKRGNTTPSLPIYR
jgi:hypothetical protein